MCVCVCGELAKGRSKVAAHITELYFQLCNELPKYIPFFKLETLKHQPEHIHILSVNLTAGITESLLSINIQCNLCIAIPTMRGLNKLEWVNVPTGDELKVGINPPIWQVLEKQLFCVLLLPLYSEKRRTGRQ